MIDLAISVFRSDHQHFLASRPDITDLMIDRQIQIVCGTADEPGEYDFGDLPQTRQEMLIGYIVCHRLQIMNPVAGCDPSAHMVGRAIMVSSETDKLQTNAAAMKNPSDWESTSCGGLFKQYLDSGAGVMAFSKRCC
jgi:hypothetical protein